MQTQFETMEP